ncbi:MAG: hydroxyisourate hydrolase [Rhodobacterales bacterium]|nr:hydroxyisourate hydrolase [Rhodobacterales bacterium]
MAGISVHAVDIAAGCPAAGLRVDLFRIAADARVALLHGGITDAAGMLTIPGEIHGRFEAVFHLGDYLRTTGHGGEIFQERLVFAFGIDKPGRHHHLPLKFTAFGCSLFLTH